MDQEMCALCGDVIHSQEWSQLTLDDTHVVRYRGAHCLCRDWILDASVGPVVMDLGAR